MKKTLVLALALVLVAGCGGSKKPTAKQTKPFVAPIEEYLRAKSMGMTIVEFESLKIEGDTATAVVRMTAKDVGYKMSPRWTWHFKKADAKWEATKAEY